MSETYLQFPFELLPDGSVATADENTHIRQRLEQILFTSPGERVMLPQFGCGVRDLVFGGNNEVLAAAAEFRIAQALQAYMGNNVMINQVDVAGNEEQLQITIVYTRRRDLDRQEVQIQLLPSEVIGGL